MKLLTCVMITLLGISPVAARQQQQQELPMCGARTPCALPELSADRRAAIQQTIRQQVPAGEGGSLTPAERAALAAETGGNATLEERAAAQGSQFEVCERWLREIGYSHVEYAGACTGLSVRDPYPPRK